MSLYTVQGEYTRLRNKGWRASEAFRAAKVKVAFKAAEFDGLVKLSYEPDPDPSVVLDGDYTDEQRADIQRSANQFGVYAILGMFRTSNETDFDVCDSCGGFLGNDLHDNGYDTDIMQACLDAMASQAS